MQIVEINNIHEAAEAMQAIGVTGRGIEIMSEKALFQAIRLERVDTRAANILKQTWQPGLRTCWCWLRWHSCGGQSRG